MTGPEITCLAEAAAEIRAALEANAGREENTRHLKDEGHATRRQIRGERLRLIDRLIVIAAIEAGLPPCCHPLRPEPARDPEETP